MTSLADIFGPRITKRSVDAKHSLSPKRRRISDDPVYKKKDGQDDCIAFPFSETMKPLFEEETGIHLYDGRYGPIKYLKSEEEKAIAFQWSERRRNYIFLRDCLDYSVALDFDLIEAGRYTALGYAEHQAKVEENLSSVSTLGEALSSAISDLKPYKQANAVCCVPPGAGKKFDLPSALVANVSKTLNMPILNGLKFEDKQKSIKSVPIDSKWEMLEASALMIAGGVKGMSIIVIDDKYQSGTTIQFVAAKLLEAGAAKVMGLYCVKTWRDTDNG